MAQLKIGSVVAQLNPPLPKNPPQVCLTVGPFSIKIPPVEFWFGIVLVFVFEFTELELELTAAVEIAFGFGFELTEEFEGEVTDSFFYFKK